MICRDTPTHGWVCGWLCESVGQWVWSGQITNYQINLDLIRIIQFCLKIYRVATAQGKQGILFLLFPDRENTGKTLLTQGKYLDCHY